MKTRDEAIEQIVKVLRLAHGAGTEAEAQNALLLAQKMMYAHGVAESEVSVEAGAPAAITEDVVDQMPERVAWREYLGAVIAENFRCAYIISASRSAGTVRLVFVGRAADAQIAGEAFAAAAVVAEHLADALVAARPEGERAAARASFLTGFLKGLLTRFDENVNARALVVLADAGVMAHAQALSNAGAAAGGALPREDAAALSEGFASGYAHAGGPKLLKE